MNFFEFARQPLTSTGYICAFLLLGSGIPSLASPLPPDRATSDHLHPRFSEQPSQQPSQQASQQTGATYVLGAGDRIQIDIFDLPEYSREHGRHQVLVDGTVNLPLLGAVPVQGLTLSELSGQLTQQYAYYLKRPVITVTLLSARPLRIGVAGEVIRPGAYHMPLTSQEGQHQQPFPTLTAALKLAGGIAQSANIRQIQIHRTQQSQPTQVMTVDLWQILQSGDLSYDPTLRDGDAIVVPTATTQTAAEMTQLATANFSPDTIQINVAGEVRQPGVIKVPPNTPLNTALLAAGGFDRKQANTKVVELIRLNPNGSVTRRQVAIDFAQGINDTTNPALRNNDVIVVNRSGSARLADTLGTVLNPVSGLLSVLGLIFR
ncbi:MAG: polysaccharide biosynthesis/export family protein [Synechococcales bacterium]|nr:polysaccharide biosynthesis/export family protein [Synechococcales bacterium]